MVLSVPASLLAAFAPSDEVLFVARVIGGLSAGMAYPTTLALIAALWSGQPRTKSIALWSAIGGGIAALGPLIAGVLLEHFDWGSVFLVTLPLVGIALVMALLFVPSHVNETTDPVDNLGGILSVVLVAALVLGINFAPVPNEGTLALGLLLVAAAAAAAFLLRQRRARNPLYDLQVAARPTFWVAACAGIIVFGSLMAAAFVSQQYLQNVLDYTTIQAGAAILPAVVFMILVAPRSAKLVEAKGARFTLLLGYVFLLAAFLWMLLFWTEGSLVLAGCSRLRLHRDRRRAGRDACLAFADGVRSGRARRDGVRNGRPAARPRRRTAHVDLRGVTRSGICDRHGSGGHVLGAGAERHRHHPEPAPALVLERGDLAEQNPKYASEILAAAKASFLEGDDWAYTAGVVAILLGAALVYLKFPSHDEEKALLSRYHEEDAEPTTA